MSKKLTQEEVIKRFKEVHGNKYDYSKVIYKKSKEKVNIICSEHGEFLQTPNNHLSGYGCSKCAGNLKLTLDEVISDFKKIHGNKYDYGKVNYKNNMSKVEIICPEHGSFFQTPSDHKSGQGCLKCYNKRRKNQKQKMKLSSLEYTNNFDIIHNNKYDYSKINYTHSHSEIEIVCPEHGSFFQKPYIHKSGHGCPKCSESKGERKVREFLEENNIKYSQEVKLFDNYRFDFYLEDLNTVIEYDGKQHFEPVDYFGGLEGFLKTQERDKIKTEYCLENNIRIIRIAYFEEVEEVLKPLITGSRELV